MKQSQLALVVVAVLCTTTFIQNSAIAAANRRPNILIVLADDQGWGDLSIHGNANLKTPSIDSLARDGALFDRFYVCPVCSPTRAEFLTGRYHPRGNVYSTSTGGERLDLDETTIAQVFKQAGYATAAFGKWHNGMQYPYHPNARGFDEFYGFCSGHWGHYFSPELEHNGELVHGEGFVIDDFTNHALQFMEANRERPFFCYLPFNTPHSPMQVPEPFYVPFSEKKLAMRHRDPEREEVPKTRAALAMCENIDWNVGRLLKKLDELKLRNDTIVLYFSDNGPNSYRWNGDMRGRKGSTDEGGVRVPLLMRWPGHIKPKTTVTRISAAIDLLPTLADLAGLEYVSEKPLDGVSLKPLLLSEERPWQDRKIFSYWNGRTSVRTDQYRLDHEGHLYDMRDDPGQRNDVATKKPAVASQLADAIAKWKSDVFEGFGEDDRPFSVGYRAFPKTHLPARDGVPHGGIQRSARPPNCSFFTNWTSTTDSMTWDVEIVNSGKYEAQVYYTCRPDDVGSTIELSFGKSRLQGKVAVAHDPPLVGATEDRTPRIESFVKDFKPLEVGTMTLEKGRGPLTLRAVDVAGKQVMDVRYVVLTLVAE